MNTDIADQLSWEEFLKESKKENQVTKVKPFNRLISHSKNLFLISGYGAFTPGYMLINSKDFKPSFGLIKDEYLDELNFLISLTKEIISEKFERSSVVFEHGMCACIGGLDRAEST